MRRSFNSIWILTLVFCMFIPAAGQAITISAPQTVEAGRPVTIVISATPVVSVDVGCALNIDFGDGSPPDTGVVACTKQGALCSASVSHTYQKAGTYVLRAYSTGCSPGAFQPDPATRSLSVVELKIQRLELYFPNRLPKISVKQYQRDLKAFVDIRYTGAGLLQGQWEIDGRLFTKVNKQLYQGVQKITLQTPLAPPLPTYAVGTHRVSFVITRPGLQIEFPQAIYFVEAESGPATLTIQLLEPFDNQTAVCGPLTLRWKTAGKAYVYLVEFIAADGKEPVFSAYAKESSYTLREELCRSLLSSGRAYRWRVKGISQEGQIIGESETYTLYLTSAEQ